MGPSNGADGANSPEEARSPEGRRYGPTVFRVCREKVGEFVSVTHDDPDRWGENAPPGFVAAMLFAVVPGLIADLGDQPGGLIHGDQSFRWHSPLPVESELAVSGTVRSRRRRAGTTFVGFRLHITRGGTPVADGDSTFLITRGPDPAADERDEPAPTVGGPNDPLPPIGSDPLPAVRRSASRLDLIRYAGATGDWNPIHWDHSAALEAGLSGIVVPGLLQSAWICQLAATANPDPRPLVAARFRYRAPLPVGASATVAPANGASGFEVRYEDVVTVTSSVRTTSMENDPTTGPL